eukprot:CAMPEP_0115474298 /NCGR_PEP_ID=MMETSP0271-20121206/54022_1 /TAXON_ID=71861 /ORGANISM="Scrippsiella trochoidea, Strain CCMP3099" /LENGTH=57 /DNA_ID=CAMNT_0002901621 /DNA_START=65 /DNA_END=234 /DNA_ORIENTATION=-
MRPPGRLEADPDRNPQSHQPLCGDALVMGGGSGEPDLLDIAPHLGDPGDPAGWKTPG